MASDRKPVAKRIGYREMLSWIAWNDDNEWLDDAECGVPSVTTVMASHLFEKEIEDVAADLRRVVKRVKTTI